MMAICITVFRFVFVYLDFEKGRLKDMEKLVILVAVISIISIAASGILAVRAIIRS